LSTLQENRHTIADLTCMLCLAWISLQDLLLHLTWAMAQVGGKL